MSDVTTRPATVADIPAINAIYSDAVTTSTGSFEIEPPDEAEMARRMAAIVDRKLPYFVAESVANGGQVLGYGYAGPYHARAGYRNTVEDSIYLAPAARGRGIGGILLRRLIDDCTAKGYRQMVAVIGDSANVASIRLHKAAGFADVGTLRNVGYKHGRWLDSVLMQRALGPGAETPPG